ncbi:MULTISPECIES: hypothetical protein [Methylobacteriaceae]|uniref:hypothetical protein n=1 Tax=Methylobacteriaceae TaxID=119045 RepID=UPI00074FA691|nr:MULTISPECIES: hypothetical protein [Methylobacteriaceae]AMB44356.1 hypothetical protein Y590_05560 [Methylobacterium sp. AMS5]
MTDAQSYTMALDLAVQNPVRVLTVTDREVAYTHPQSGARTHLLTIAERRRLRPLEFDAALDLIADGYEPVVNAKSGRR